MPEHFFTTPDSSEKRIGLVYNTDIQKYQPLDFSKIDDIESLLRNSSSATNIDAFGRLRVSQPFTLGDYSHAYGEETELLTKTSGTNSKITFNILKAEAQLQVGTGANDFTIHQSRMYHHYMPGKSQVTLQSFNFSGVRSGTNKRVGLFDDKNGIYFMQSGDGSLHMVLRNNVSGVVYDEMVYQNDWNTDTCNGSGFSQFDLNPTKTQLFWADYEWLGVGRIRVGFVHEGSFITAHQFYNSNLKDSVYLSNPNLPVRCDIRNYSSTTGVDCMQQICATVFSEGGYSEAGVDFGARTTGFRNIDAQASLPVMAIRLKTGYYGQPNRSVVRLGSLEFYSSSQPCSYDIARLPSGASLIGGSWVSVGDDSVVEYNVNATGFSLSGANIIDVGFVQSNSVGVGNASAATSSIASASTAKRSYLSQNIDSNDSNIFCVIMKNYSPGGGSSATNAFVGMQWRETR
jgi:hypothetical protein